METRSKFAALTVAVTVWEASLVSGAIFSSAQAAQEPAATEPPADNQEAAPAEPHMPEALRSSIRKLVVISGSSPAGQEVTGSYGKETAGLVGGMDAGSRMGTISKEIGGVPVHIPIPGLAIPGAIFGGLSGATKRRIQEFRDALTEELVQAESPPLRSDGLALDVYWGVQRLPGLESHLFSPTVAIPNDTDAVLYVNFGDLTIDVQGRQAIITTAAAATVHRPGDGKDVYQTVVRYQDRDTLKNWTANDNALWRDYTNFARYYLGREVAADVFARVKLNHELRLKETDTAKRDRKNQRKLISRSPAPTLAWELELKGGDSYGAWTETIGEADIYYDIEIFDDRQLVYDEKLVPDPRHAIAFDLEPCHTYRWSVRPAYRVDGEMKFGEWMRFESASEIEDEEEAEAETASDPQKGIFGRRASDAPAYTQDFALLEIECGRR